MSDASTESTSPPDHPLLARKIELLEHLRKAIGETGIDGRDADDNTALLNALCDLVSMMIAATADDVEATTRLIADQVLPPLVGYFQQSPDSNFWPRRQPN